MSDIAKIEAKMNLLVNFYNRSKKDHDHITLSRKETVLLDQNEKDIMGLKKDGGHYTFRGYKVVMQKE